MRQCKLITTISRAFRTRNMATRTYKDAIDHLNTLQSNASTLDAIRSSGTTRSEFVIPEMREYLGRIGYAPDDLNRLNVIHITGTKGKGSTSAFVDSILRHCRPQWNIGLYTSPHLIAVRERIRINGIPIGEEDFAKFFFDVWDRLGSNQLRKDQQTAIRPMYFRFLTLVAFHAFITLKVDATILEVGVGGTYDCTNLVPKPVVTAITSIGIDHVAVLGKTIPEIAWQKGGIFKEGVPAFAIEQGSEALDVLRLRAKELKASKFTTVPITPGISNVKLGLAGTHQRQNASLALQIAHSYLRQEGPILSPPFIAGLQQAKWPGRCQEVKDHNSDYANVTWFLDGAHTVESLDCCMEWFVDPQVGFPPSKRAVRVLIFNCTSGRSGGAFLESMLRKATAQLKLHGIETGTNDTWLSLFDHVVFCTNVTYADGQFKADLTKLAISPGDTTELKTQQQLAAAWSALVPAFPKSAIHVLPSIEHAVNVIRELSKENADASLYVLAAGSLHLVGGVIEVGGLSEVAL